MKTCSVVIGASAGVGRALSEELAKLGHDLFLTASDERDLEAQAADLSLRFGVRVFYQAADLKKLDTEGLRSRVVKDLGGVDNLFLIAGLVDMERDPVLLKPSEVQGLIDVNFTGAVQLATAFLEELKASAQGNLIGAGSVASIRGRRQNTIYAGCKRGLEFIFEGLMHATAATQCRVQYYRIGYVDTSMTFGQKPLLPKADPRAVALHMIEGLGRHRVFEYFPGWWSLVMAIYSRIPWFLFKRL